MPGAEDFYRQYRTHYILSRRPPAPPGQMVATDLSPQSANFSLMYNDTTEMGTISFMIGNAGNFPLPPPQADAPYLYQPVGTGRALPRILIITGFHSHYEHQNRGIGSAMLREILRIADTAECQYVGVSMGVNHAVYSALGFDLIDPQAESWCMPTARLRARLSPLRRYREAP